MQFALSEYPGFLPGFAISIILGTVFRGSIVRRLGITRGLAWLLIVSLGAILAATLTPGIETLSHATRAASCDLSRFGPAPWAEYVAFGTTSLNVLLFVPLGVAIGALPASRIKVLLVIGSLVLPIAIEAIQLVIVPLARACQGGDVFDNLVGLTLGLTIGWAVARIGVKARTSASGDPP